jgi:hypothetical protein
LEGLRHLIDQGDPEPVALEMVIAGLAKTGRLRDASDLLLEAINGKCYGIIPLEKISATLVGLSMKGAKEDDYAREFVEVGGFCIPIYAKYLMPRLQ